jgi:hypothetical protein
MESLSTLLRRCINSTEEELLHMRKREEELRISKRKIYAQRALKARIRNRLGTHKPIPFDDLSFEYNVLTVFSDHTFLEYRQWTVHRDEALLLAKCIRATGRDLNNYITAYLIKRRVK